MLRTRLEFLSSDDLDLIHDQTMRVLAEVGVIVPVGGALEIFTKHGARVDGQRVYLDEGLVSRALSSVPSEFTIHARDAERSVVVGGDGHVLAPAYGAPFVTEPDGTARPALLEDYESLTRLADVLPNMDMSGHMLVEPSDVSPSRSYLFTLRASMVNSSKPFIGSSQGAAGARASAAMAGILFSDQNLIRERPVMMSLINSLSPLGYSGEMIEALMEHARWRQPVVVAPAAQAGASSPVTIAGTLVVQNVEILTGITLSQLINPGTPVVYGSASATVDMRTGNTATGSPELSVFVVCTGQMARYYQLPSRAGGCLTDSHIPDAQAAMESMMSMQTAVHSGINFILHAGGMLSSHLTVSYEKMIIDDEICGMVRRFEKGFDTSAEDLAFDVIAGVGPGGSFLMEPHTVERCRTEFYCLSISSRQGIDAWQQQGRLSSLEVARERWRSLLESHVPPAPDAITMAQLDRYIEAHP